MEENLTKKLNRGKVMSALDKAGSFDDKITICDTYLTTVDPDDALIRFKLGDTYCRKANSAERVDFRFLQRGLIELDKIKKEDDIYPVTQEYKLKLEAMIGDDERVGLEQRVTCYTEVGKVEERALLSAACLLYEHNEVNKAAELLADYVKRTPEDISLLVPAAKKSLNRFLDGRDAAMRAEKGYTYKSLLDDFFEPKDRAEDVAFLAAGLYAGEINHSSINVSDSWIFTNLLQIARVAMEEKLTKGELNEKVKSEVSSKKNLIDFVLANDYTSLARNYFSDVTQIKPVFNERRCDSTKSCYERVLDIDPQNIEALVFLGDYYFHRGVLVPRDAKINLDSCYKGFIYYAQAFTSSLNNNLPSASTNKFYLEEEKMPRLFLCSSLLSMYGQNISADQKVWITQQTNFITDCYIKNMRDDYNGSALCDIILKLPEVHATPRFLDTQQKREDEFYHIDPLSMNLQKEFDNPFVGEKTKTLWGVVYQEVERLSMVKTPNKWKTLWEKLW